jgi:hypothetical protein
VFGLLVQIVDGLVLNGKDNKPFVSLALRLGATLGLGRLVGMLRSRFLTFMFHVYFTCVVKTFITAYDLLVRFTTA